MRVLDLVAVVDEVVDAQVAVAVEAEPTEISGNWVVAHLAEVEDTAVDSEVLQHQLMGEASVVHLQLPMVVELLPTEVDTAAVVDTATHQGVATAGGRLRQ